MYFRVLTCLTTHQLRVSFGLSPREREGKIITGTPCPLYYRTSRLPISNEQSSRFNEENLLSQAVCSRRGGLEPGLKSD